ncbi:ribonuclease H-like domain-containing protein [Tanacetum coccineum]
MAIGDASGSSVELINNHDAGYGYENCFKRKKNKMEFIDELYVGQVYSEIALEVWNELKETYDKMDGSVVFNLMHKINNLKQGDLFVPDYYHKLNSLWREFDILIILPACFLMGLNDIYQPIRSTILAKDPLPNAMDIFYVVSREESHRGLHPGSSSSRRCYEIIGYPTGFKRNPNLSRHTRNNNNKINANTEVNHSVPRTSGSISSSFTNEHMVKLLSLINEKPTPAANKFGIEPSLSNNNDLNLGKLVGTRSVTGGLYLFDLDKIGMFATCNYVFVCNVSSELYHYRLGHPAEQVLSIFGKKLGFSKKDHLSPCDICHRAKQTREPFPLSDHKSKSVGDIVHCDVWGPYGVVSEDGFKYFLTIVDDYSRAVWVYLLKSKTEVGKSIESFIKLVFTQFGKKVKVVRSDNGTKFVNHHLSNLFNDLGIIHQTSCAYTPQQNGVAERKHRHLLNVTRSLMFQGGSLCLCGLDVKFDENVFPFKMKNSNVFSQESNEENSLKFFDVQNPESPYDEEGDTSTEDDNSRIASDDCTAVEDEVARGATHIEENVTSEGNVHVNQNGEGRSSPIGVSPELRRSIRPKVMPARFNDFVVNSSVRYGLEKYVCYNNLSKRNLCFSTTLNKTTEPKIFQEASQNPKWVEFTNHEMEALFRNNTYVLVDLPPKTKAIGYEWLWRIVK